MIIKRGASGRDLGNQLLDFADTLARTQPVCVRL
jgi:hypothetical protein